MKRGTILWIPPEPLRPAPNLLPTFRYACMYRPVFVRFLGRYLAPFGVPFPTGSLEGFYARYCGDVVESGLGEILVWSG